MLLKFVALAMLITAGSVTIRRKKQVPTYVISGDHILDDSHHDSMPGTPVVPRWEQKALFEQTPWRAKLGDRIFKAATVDPKAWTSCGTFLSFGDSAWCKKALPAESPKKFYNIRPYDVPASTSASEPPSSTELVALSYGIQEGDLWSEIMSNVYNLKTKLYDCYIDTGKGPMANEWYTGKPCTGRNCYSVQYEANHVCLDEYVSERTTGTNGKEYEPLSLALKDRKPLSVLLKIDVEGSEWPVLEKLLENNEDMAKIRSLDMEIHLNMEPSASHGNTPGLGEESLERRVKIMEKLAEKFAVTGSSLEHMQKAIIRDYTQKREADPTFEVTRPALVYTSNGLPLDQYVISYVNRNLL